jgi:hypothetical protein
MQRAARGRFAVVSAVAGPWVIRHLRRDGLERTLAHIDRMDPLLTRAIGRLAGRLDPADAQAAVGWAFRMAPHLQGQCLEQALTQYALQRTDDVRFVVGVQRDEADDFGAHAWVEGAATPGDVADFAPILVREGP